MGDRRRVCGLAIALAALAMARCGPAENGSGSATVAPEAAPSRTPADLAPQARALHEAAAELRARSRAIRARAESLDAEALLRSLPVNVHTGPVLRLDDLLAEAQVEGSPPKHRRTQGSERVAFEFEGDDPVAFVPSAGAAEQRDGSLVLRQVRDAYLVSKQPLALERDAVGEIELRMRVNRSARAELGWTTAGPDERPGAWRELFESSGVITVDLVPDGRFHLYRVDATAALRRGVGRGPILRSVFLRASNTPGETVAVDFLRFVPRRDRYAERVAGTAHEVRAGEMRPVLHVASPAALGFDLEVPQRDPRLDFGVSVLETGDPVRFSVRVDGDEVFSRTVEDADSWSDASVSLVPFAGRRVRLSLETSSQGGNVAFWSSPRVSGAPPRPFHVIVLLEDALRADALSAYGRPPASSPHHDALAARGVTFERAFAQATKTRPSCPSWMTSLLPSATGVWDHTGMLDDAYLTLAEVLRSQGFVTVSFLQNSNAGPAAGLHQGFDHVFEPSRVGEGPEIFDVARTWIAQHADRNLFAYVHVLDPHGRYEPPAPFDADYRERGPGTSPIAPDRLRFDPAWVEVPTIQGRRLLYAGEVRHNDALLGGFLDALDARGVLDHALVVSIADHGEHLGEEGRWGHDPPGTPEVLRVPLIFTHPSLRAGTRVAANAQLLDVAPTVLEMAGVDVSALPLQGDSLLPWMRGAPGGDRLSRRVVVSEEPTAFHSRAQPRRSGSVFFGETQVLRSAVPGAARVLPPPADDELRRQLEAEADDLLDALQADGRAIWTALSRGPAEEVRLDPAAQEQLRALGYIE